MTTKKRVERLEQEVKPKVKKLPLTWRELIESDIEPEGWAEFIGEQENDTEYKQTA